MNPADRAAGAVGDAADGMGGVASCGDTGAVVDTAETGAAASGTIAGAVSVCGAGCTAGLSACAVML